VDALIVSLLGGVAQPSAVTRHRERSHDAVWRDVDERSLRLGGRKWDAAAARGNQRYKA
jgi:hypothetical protein